jgi:hypothetical protein
LEGVVTAVEWANPHVYLQIETIGDSVERWVLEGDNVAQTARQCWKRDSVQPGDEVVVLANPPRDRDKRLGHLTMLEKDGRVLWDYRSPCTEGSISGHSASVNGVWNLEPADFSLDQNAALPPYDGRRAASLRSLPLTRAGADAVEVYSDETVTLFACTPVTPPLSLIGGGPIAIEVGEDTVVVREANFATTRTVHVNVDSHGGASESLLGHSIGAWDGSTFVVDTAHFAEHPEGNLRLPPFRLPSSNQRHLREWFSLADEGQTLIYRFEFSDPVYLTEPVRGERRFTYALGIDFDPVPCSAENARRFLADDRLTLSEAVRNQDSR